MKRYLSFFRSTSTVSLVILYLLTTFLFPFSAAAEGAVENIREFDPVVINSRSLEYNQQQFTSLQNQESVDVVTFDISEDFEEDVSFNYETISFQGELSYNNGEDEFSVTANNDSGQIETGFRAPVIDSCGLGETFPIILSKSYVEAQSSSSPIATLLNINAAINSVSVDIPSAPEGYEIEINNNISDLFPFSAGFYTINFFADDDCVVPAELTLFVYGLDVSCPVEDVFVAFSYEGDWNVFTGSGTQIQQGQFIPLTHNDGQDFVPNEPSGVVDGFVRVVRTGSNFVIIRNGLEDETILDQILENIEFFNANQGDFQLYPYASGGGFLMIYFTLDTDCVSDQEDTEDDEPEESNPNGGGGGSSTSRIMSRQRVQAPPQGEVLGVSTPTCDFYITTFMAKHYQNKSEDVRRLQIFLNDYMAESLVVNGEYNNATYEAVKRFQTQESDEILAPWGITEATGIVKETTSRHINNIMCSELQIEIPILFCVTTQTFLYPDGRVLTPDEHYNLVLGEYFENDGISNINTPVQSSNNIWEFEK